ncbi:phosphatidylinositol-3,5-bisphosphate 5-phosphatase [Recurvomyces mirabilis]|uniref:Phosphatidylinositol-3,5-bisphosphate 5-phosphatase n=1 Tax=Recurvomyces mirabilis TaxID=574656 RepID=A0AAE1C4P8_9PEZI|nr:phosphatidylinositol-3,5-bisphosphate 5-phosphatase [Recurvomyces mirabilis]KAK5160613.1 phosphatidylinositol-3,5-bisphosphate 5-phosphatase [Recurvomyces mirabilis]
MDHGPVDAAPNADADYQDPSARPESRDDARLNIPRRGGGFRVASRSRSREFEQNGSGGDHASTRSRSRRPSYNSESAGSFDDGPVLKRVGAVDGEEDRDADGEGDGGEIHLTEKGHHDMPEHDAVDEGDGAGPNTAGSTRDRSHRMYKFTLYETNARYWITGADVTDKSFRLLRIDRTSPPGQVVLFEDATIYDRRQMNEVLTSIDEGNRATGGLRLKYGFFGLLGFIRFTEAHYMLPVTKRQQAAMIGGHYVYQIEDTEMVPLTTGASSRFMRDRNPEELRFLGILNNLDLNKHFYFSYAYDITHSLQHNIITQRAALADGRHDPKPDFNAMFVWNHHLLKPATAALKHPFDWCLPIIHGFIDQTCLDIFGRSVYITIIGRRSRHFAGARFLKRGVNDLGYVANDVETEQIVAEKLTTSFHAPGPKLYSNPTYTSYLHHRGSIPLYWTQDNSGVTPKPDIDINLNDPFYQPAALHFDNLFERYGCPLYILNLIKARERTPRESKLLAQFAESVDYLNQSLPPHAKVIYKTFDMSRASKTRGGDVIGSLETIASEILNLTNFFHNDPTSPRLQNGIARTNCIDCLDRTNAAQFVIGKHALSLQLRALGLYPPDPHPTIPYDTDCINTFTSQFHSHGDTIAVQYGGSHLVNTMATYRKLNHWQSSSRDMVESFKRYYHNSFLDSQRQEAYNLFLGNYVWVLGEPRLWELGSDYYLHHSGPRGWGERRKGRRSYIFWFTPEFLHERVMPVVSADAVAALNDVPGKDDVGKKVEGKKDGIIPAYDEYWLECYRPTALSSLQKIYSYRINAEHRFLPDRPHANRDGGKYNFSPFVPRLEAHQRRPSIDSPDKRQTSSQQQQHQRKGVTILDPMDDAPSLYPPSEEVGAGGGIPPPRNVPSSAMEIQPTNGILREPTQARRTSEQQQQEQAQMAPDKATMHLWSLEKIHRSSLHPSVSVTESREYERYISHPLHLPLVTNPTDHISSDRSSSSSTAAAPSASTTAEYIAYLSLTQPSILTSTSTSHPTHQKKLNGGHVDDVDEADLQQFLDFVADGREEDVLTVTEGDGGKKRYKAYRQWLRGKSLFKQSKVDPEYRTG